MSEKITIKDIAKQLEHQELKEQELATLIKNIFEIIEKEVNEDNIVRIKRFGIFKKRVSNPRTCKHPGTGKVYTSQKRCSIQYTPSKSVKKIAEK